MIRSIFAGYSRSMALLSRLTLITCGLALIVIIGSTGWQVYGRYVLNDPPSWVESLALLLLLYIAFPGAAVGVRERFHLGIIFLLDRLPPSRRRMMDLAGILILLGFGIAMTIGGYDAAAQTWSVKDPILPIPRGTYYVPISIAGILMILFGIEHTCEHFLGVRDPKGTSEESGTLTTGDVL